MNTVLLQMYHLAFRRRACTQPKLAIKTGGDVFKR